MGIGGLASGVEHPHAALRAVHRSLVDAGEPAVLADDTLATRRRSLDAIDPAYDTFACALLDGEVDPAGYPEYASVVGGVAAHWDESTGDLIVRGVVGWGGRGTRGDTDRIATRLLGRLLGSILESGDYLGLASVERPGAGPAGTGVTCQHCGYPNVHPRAVYCPKCGMRMLHA